MIANNDEKLAYKKEVLEEVIQMIQGINTDPVANAGMMFGYDGMGGGELKQLLIKKINKQIDEINPQINLI